MKSPVVVRQILPTRPKIEHKHRPEFMIRKPGSIAEYAYRLVSSRIRNHEGMDGVAEMLVTRMNINTS